MGIYCKSFRAMTPPRERLLALDISAHLQHPDHPPTNRAIVRTPDAMKTYPSRHLDAIRHLLGMIAILWSGSFLPVYAGSPELIPLWPDAAPLAGGSADGDIPRIELYRVKSDQPTAAILILPGGGYGGLATGHEGVEMAEYFNSLGMTAAVCIYRHRGKGNDGKGYGHPVPWTDASRAMRLLRANHQSWNIEPTKIGIIGFSAGGHLASTVSTKFDPGKQDSKDPVERASSRPDFAILGYPVISFGAEHTHQGSQRNLLGDNPDPELIKSLSNENAVSPQTPPTFLLHTAEDQPVPAQNSLSYASALLKAGVPVELHVFEAGPHGIGLGQGRPGADAWPKLCAQWLRNRKFIGE